MKLVTCIGATSGRNLIVTLPLLVFMCAQYVWVGSNVASFGFGSDVRQVFEDLSTFAAAICVSIACTALSLTEVGFFTAAVAAEAAGFATTAAASVVVSAGFGVSTVSSAFTESAAAFTESAGGAGGSSANAGTASAIAKTASIKRFIRVDLRGFACRKGAERAGNVTRSYDSSRIRFHRGPEVWQGLNRVQPARPARPFAEPRAAIRFPRL